MQSKEYSGIIDPLISRNDPFSLYIHIDEEFSKLFHGILLKTKQTKVYICAGPFFSFRLEGKVDIVRTPFDMGI
jgi:hypothetical protein